MPGAGGGSHGGGGFGGSGFGRGFGGSSSGGGFGGRPYRYGGFGFFPFFWGPRLGGGCMGGLLLGMIAPVILVVIAASMVLTSVFSVVAPSRLQDLPFYQVDDELLYDYTLDCYNDLFDEKDPTYEDNIVISFLVDEKTEGYAFFAIVGDNITPRINRIFGNEQSELGEVLENWIPENYARSLGKNLGNAMIELGDAIAGLGLKSSFRSNGEKHDPALSRVINHSSLVINEDILNDGLVYFTEETDIPIVFVIEDASSLLTLVKKTWTDVLPTLFIGGVILAVAIGSVVYGIVRYKRTKRDNRSSGTTGSGSDPGGGNSSNGGMWY